LVTYLNQTPIFEWYVIRWGSKNAYWKDMCSKKIGLCGQNMITILGSIVNMIGGPVLPFNELDFMSHELDFHMSFDNYEGSDYGLWIC
jgi:hypothetical protein